MSYTADSIRDSNRYSRFDSYSIRTQTADSQVPNFFYKTSCIEKNTQIYTMQNGGSQSRGAGSEIRWDPPPI